MLDKVLFSAAQLESLVANLIRIGEVTSINPEAFTARVRFEDRDNVESYDLRILVRGSLRDKFFHMPDIGENVLCLFLPSGVEAGFILGAYYPGPVDRPAASEDITAVEFADGTRIEYDRVASNLLVDMSASSGTVNVICKSATVQADESVLVETATATVVADAVTLDTPQTTCTGNLVVMGGFAMIGGGGSGSAQINGPVKIVGPVEINGGSLTHNGKNVGSDHTHSGVQPGSGNTGGPV